MTQKEIFIIKAIWGPDSKISKKDILKKDIIRNANKSLNFQKK
jgi:hypothetical protein